MTVVWVPIAVNRNFGRNTQERALVEAGVRASRRSTGVTWTGHQKYVFPGQRTKRSISDAAVNTALRTMGYAADEVVAHGFRATARTMLAEILAVKPILIEAQLAHTVKDPLLASKLGTSYDRAKWLKHRAAMLQLWADYLDHLRDPITYPFTPPELQLTEALNSVV